MESGQFSMISGQKDGHRLDSRILEEHIQDAVFKGKRHLIIKAFGQHGIGGRIWKAGNEPVKIKIDGYAGQRVGSMGFPNTFIEVMGPASDDVGWLNAGAKIVVHGNATNGVANGMAQGKIYIAGNIGSRGMTMTKYNPRSAATSHKIQRTFWDTDRWWGWSAARFFSRGLTAALARQIPK